MWALLKNTFGKWSAHKDARLGAALAYYSIFSMGPLIIIAIAVAGVVFGQDVVRGEIGRALHGLLGDSGAQAVDNMLQAASKPREGLLPTLIGVGTLLFAAIGVVVQLKDALNTVWEVEPSKETGVWAFLRTYVLSFAAVLATGFLLLVSMLLTAVLAAMGKFLAPYLPEGLFHVVGFAASFAVMTALFAAMFRWMPDAEVPWKAAWIGALVTAFLFEVGKTLIGLYIGKQGLESSFGAAASLVVVLIWVYYTAQIVLLGAEFTRAYQTRNDPVPSGATASKPARNHATGSELAVHSTAPSSGAAPMSAYEPSVEELRRESERNRAALSSTVTELRDKLNDAAADVKTLVSPTHIQNEVKGYVRDSSEQFVDGIRRKALDNPLPALAIGAGLTYTFWGLLRSIPAPVLLMGAGAWLATKSGKASTAQIADKATALAGNLQDQTSALADRARSAATDLAGSVADRVSNLTGGQTGSSTAGQSGSNAGGLRQTVADTAAKVSSQASATFAPVADASNRALQQAREMAHDGMDAMTAATNRVMETGRQTGTAIGQAVENNPMVVAGVGLAVGAFIAAALPPSSAERRVVGKAGGMIKQKAAEAAAMAVGNVIGRAEEAIGNVVDTVTQEAEKQGLHADGIGEKVQQLTDNVKAVVDRGVQTALGSPPSQDNTQQQQPKGQQG